MDLCRPRSLGCGSRLHRKQCRRHQLHATIAYHARGPVYGPASPTQITSEQSPATTSSHPHALLYRLREIAHHHFGAAEAAAGSGLDSVVSRIIVSQNSMACECLRSTL